MRAPFFTTIEKSRTTRETSISLSLNVIGSRQIKVLTGLPFFDHMLEQLAFHARWDLQLTCKGDSQVDDHHSIEDVAIVLGEAFAELQEQAKSSGVSMQRYGQRLLPMDGTLMLAALDLDGRGCAVIDMPFTRASIGGVATEMWQHFFTTLAHRGRFSLHLKTMYFDNQHHLIESAFKAVAYAMREALQMNNADSESSRSSTKDLT